MAIIHVGPWKTGTTEIQNYIHRHSKTLKLDGFLTLPIDVSNETNMSSAKLAKELAKAGNGLAPCFGQEMGYGPKCSKGLWKKFVSFLHKSEHKHQSIIISAEQFQNVKMNITLLEKTLREEGNFTRIKIVVGYRRVYDWLKSSYFQMHRPDFQMNRPEVAKSEDVFPSLVEEIIDMIRIVKNVHTRALVERYNEHFQDVAIFNMYATKPMVAQFFCKIIIAPRTCTAILQTPQTRKVNGRGWNLDLHRLVIAAKKKSMLEADASSQKAVKALGLKELPNDLPRQCLSKENMATLLQLSLKEESELLPRFFQSAEGEAKLREDFLLASNTSLCSLDVDEVLRDELWKDFVLEIGNTLL